MATIEGKKLSYNEAVSQYKGYIDTFNSIFKLKTTSKDEIKQIFEQIKTNLIEPKIFTSKLLILSITNLVPYNNRYFKSYWELFKLIYEKYPVKKHYSEIPEFFDYFIYKQYGSVLDQNHEGLFDKCEPNKYLFEIHEKNTIYRAIMDDDIELFITFIEREDFDKQKLLTSEFYPPSNKGYSYLELCCYHGAVGCFKLLRTKFNSEITEDCLNLSFLGANQEIMNECLKFQKPTEESMGMAIMSHNIDFVFYLLNEHGIKIDLSQCSRAYNVEVFLAHLDSTNDINGCFNASPIFNLLPLTEYLFSLGADIDTKGEYDDDALHLSAQYNCAEIAEFLISQGADLNANNRFNQSPIFECCFLDSAETAQVLISHGAKLNLTDNIYGETSLHKAAGSNCVKVAKILLENGENANAKEKHGKTPLHVAAEHNYTEIAELLLSHGADINAKDNEGKTPLKYADENNNET